MTEFGTMSWAAASGGRVRGLARAGQIVAALRVQLLRRFRGRPKDAGLASDGEIDRLLRCLALPETPLVAQACALVDELGPPALANHAYRTWAWGLFLGLRDGRSFDHETFALAALLHDLALPRRSGTSACFAADGAAQAQAELARWGAPREQQTCVGEAICLHLRTEVPVELGVEAHLVHAGAAVDLLGGGRLRAIPPRIRDHVLTTYPRGAVTSYLVERLARESAVHPDSRIALWVSLGFLKRIQAASVEAP